ncbi:thioesterase domain-containing protein [Paraglaciecola sp.]|uniref:thioesterase II family protein n=1 Tax=Paraglaciecola sp. TaxID=1920173 RepID=UPI0030F48DFB
MNRLWFNCPQPRPNAKVRLICFPFAGGNASTYIAWASRLDSFIELIAVQLPGRANRFNEPAIADMDELIAAMFTPFQKITDKPYVFFGHSLGSRMAFSLMLACKKVGLPGPVHFFASGSKGPQHAPRANRISHLDDQQFIQALRTIGGTPKILLDNPEQMNLYLPLLRADFAISENFKLQSSIVFDCPLTVLGGAEDDEISKDELLSWQKHFTVFEALHILAGNHFFVNSAQEQIISILNQALSNINK